MLFRRLIPLALVCVATQSAAGLDRRYVDELMTKDFAQKCDVQMQTLLSANPEFFSDGSILLDDFWGRVYLFGAINPTVSDTDFHLATYLTFSSAQVNSMMKYITALGNSESEEISRSTATNLALLNLVECITPNAGTVAGASSELSEPFVVASNAIECNRWFEMSHRVLDLDPALISPEEPLGPLHQIQLDTIGQCKEDT